MSIPTITLTILEPTFEGFKNLVKKTESFLPYIQVDIMDGQFVPATSFAERLKINTINTPQKFELHLMVTDPIAEMRSWQAVDNVFRVLFHLESVVDPLRPISFARKEGWEVGMVINPDTPLEKVLPYLKRIDVLQFMTVYPGAQGAPFEAKVLAKIKEFITWRNTNQPINQSTNKPLCAVDGAVNLTTIKQLQDAGVEIFNVGSYLTKATDIKKAYEALVMSLRGKSSRD